MRSLGRHLPFPIWGFGKLTDIIEGWMLHFTNRSQEASSPVGQSGGGDRGEKGKTPTGTEVTKAWGRRHQVY